MADFEQQESAGRQEEQGGENQNPQNQNQNQEEAGQWYWWAIILVLLIGGYLLVANAQDWWPFSGREDDLDGETADRPETDEVCVEVVTRAENPQTGEIVEFPTPCDVPADWIIQNPEEVGLDIIEILGLKSVLDEDEDGDGQGGGDVAGSTTSPRTGAGEWFMVFAAFGATFIYWITRRKEVKT